MSGGRVSPCKTRVTKITREGEEDDEVALRKRRAVAQIFRQRDGGGQGDDAAHAGPADDEDRARMRKAARAGEGCGGG